MSATVQTLKREGFAGQKLRVVPRTIIRAALDAPITSQILVTDCGYFPQAGSHGRVRPGGAGQTIVIVCSQGRGWAEIEGMRHEVSPRQALIIPRRAAHAYGAQARDPWTIWWLHLAGEQMPQLTAACGVTVQRPVMDVPRFALSVAHRRSDRHPGARRHPSEPARGLGRRVASDDRPRRRTSGRAP